MDTDQQATLPKAVGIHLAGEFPTNEERARLKALADRELPPGYRIRRTVAFDCVTKQRIVRLDAIEVR